MVRVAVFLYEGYLLADYFSCPFPSLPWFERCCFGVVTAFTVFRFAYVTVRQVLYCV